ncbi:hypothetical protein [Vibrio quintilis]|uniref:Uncharacterized protein n=1 Tax=Vibrio quintilis TaxID=1117707 RepID=A0A1M7YV31_9VIBR|nr:hypothetical protein [Vibrio quintilis]SHO56465.1 hypothetical protein VQ7734_02234 [Vibrio quintilis]
MTDTSSIIAKHVVVQGKIQESSRPEPQQPNTGQAHINTETVRTQTTGVDDEQLYQTLKSEFRRLEAEVKALKQQLHAIAMGESREFKRSMARAIEYDHLIKRP